MTWSESRTNATTRPASRASAPDAESDSRRGHERRDRRSGQSSRPGACTSSMKTCSTELRPDLILTQEQCDVCAVNEVTVRRAAAGRCRASPTVESVNPTTLAEVFAMFRRVAVLLDRVEQAETLWPSLRPQPGRSARRQAALGNSGPTSPPPRVLLLRVARPALSARVTGIPRSSNWPAGSTRSVAPARNRTDHLGRAASRPDVIVVSPCGYALETAARPSSTDRPSRMVSIGGRSQRPRGGRRWLGLLFRPAPGSKPVSESSPPRSTPSASATWLRRKARAGGLSRSK